MPDPQDIGVAAYINAFGLRFVAERDVPMVDALDPDIRVLPAASRRGLPVGLAGQRVAIVGNGRVTGCGTEIDRHDVVIRLSTMRHWVRSAVDDGTRLDVWAGNPWVHVRREGRAVVVDDAFRRAVDEGIDLLALSPFHISLASHLWLKEQGALERLRVAPAPSALFDRIAAAFAPEDIERLYGEPTDGKGLVGLSRCERLLSGTRLMLLLELAGVRHLGLYGFSLFTDSHDPVWFGHDLANDLAVMLGVKRRLGEAGGTMTWHEEAAVRSRFAST